MSIDQDALSTDRDGPRISPEVWRVAIVLILGTVMTILDTTIVNIALDPLTKDFHTRLDTIQWVVTGYLLSIAAVIPLTAWLARRFGPKRLYIVSMIIFTLGSMACGLAHSVQELIAFRVVQGLGGGAIAPVGQMMLVRVAGPKNLPRVMSAYGVPTILAPVFGPTIGGLILVHAGWRWIFFVNLPIGILAVITGLRRLPNEDRQAAGPIDLTGLLLVAAGLVGLTYGLSQTSASGNKLLHVALPIALGVVLVVGFVLRSLRIKAPLLDMRLYLNKVFARASIATFCLGGSLTGTSILMPLYFQSVRHQSALNAGLLSAPRGIGATFGTWASGRMMERFGTGPTAVIGTFLVMVFTLPYLALGSHTPFLYVCGIQTFQGFGIGISIMPAMTAAYRSMHGDKIHDATPQLNTLQRVGSSLGTAILIAVLTHGLNGAGASDSAQAHAFGVTFGWVAGITAVALAGAFFLTTQERRLAREAPEEPVVGFTPVEAGFEAPG